MGDGGTQAMQATEITDTYVLARTPEEAERLQIQGMFFNQNSEYLLRRAGIEPGMRVLDVGCGAGDLSLLAAGLVGPEGSVLGVDLDDGLVRLSARRAEAAGLRNVRFEQRDLTDLTLPEPVDAVVGRLVLMHLPDPAKALGHLRGLVRPGGVVTFQEPVTSGVRTEPATPLMTRAIDLIIRSLNTVGIDMDYGASLSRVHREAGLPVDGMAAATAVSVDAKAAAEFVVVTLRTALPFGLSAGLATAEDVALDTYADRLAAEAADADATFFLPQLVGAWARV